MTTHLLFLAGFLVLPLFGLWTWRIDAVRRMDRTARIAVAFAAGAVALAIVMAALSLMGVRWAWWVVGVGALLFTFSTTRGFRFLRRAHRSDRDQSIATVPLERTPTLVEKVKSKAPTLIFVLLTCYGLLTARESAGDLHFFWGPKAIGFYNAGGIDPGYLADKIHPNADYPPLLPLLYAWSQTIAHQFSWWAALMTTVLFLFGSVAIVRACSGDDDGAVLIAATLSFAFAIGFAGGGADPPLVFFETLTLAALTFLDDSRGRDLLAAIGLAGAAWTKIEGATFVIAVVIAVIVVQRSVKRALLIAAPAAILLASWLAFLITNKLVFGYGGAKMGVYLDALPKTLLLTGKSGMYELFALPWIIPIVLLAMGRPKKAALPLVVAVLTVVAAIFFYIHLPDPAWWIAASAPRVLLTPLMALLIAAVAATRGDKVAAHGVVS